MGMGADVRRPALSLLLKDVPRSMDKYDFENDNVGTAAKFLRDSQMFRAVQIFRRESAH
jgi:hypothetical protein